MPADSGNTAEKQLRQACADLDERLRAGKSTRAETFLATYPLLASHPDYAVELIYTEFVAREELESHPTPEEYYFRFPHWTEQLKRQFSVHQWLSENLGEDLSHTGAGAEGEATSSTASGTEAGHRWLGQYELLEEIASGGCGRVYKAWQHGLDRVVAVKILLPKYSSSLASRERFCREAKLMASLPHPNIMPVHDIGESRGILFFSMNFMSAGSLAQRLIPPAKLEQSENTLATRSDPLPADAASLVSSTEPDTAKIEPEVAVGWLETVARAVHYAHQHQIIHRDLKPSNILLDDELRPVITDFGLAKLPTAANDPEAPEQIVGSPAYMAPEQLSGEPESVSPATDIWALGVILYELLSGRRPFEGVTLPLLQRLICFHEPPRLAVLCPGLDQRLDGICFKCLAKEPPLRYGSALQLAEAARSYLKE
jgi:serine/threonine-protein kinase